MRRIVPLVPSGETELEKVATAEPGGGAEVPALEPSEVRVTKLATTEEVLRAETKESGIISRLPEGETAGWDDPSNHVGRQGVPNAYSGTESWTSIDSSLDNNNNNDEIVRTFKDELRTRRPAGEETGKNDHPRYPGTFSRIAVREELLHVELLHVSLPESSEDLTEWGVSESDVSKEEPLHVPAEEELLHGPAIIDAPVTVIETKPTPLRP